MQYLKLIEFKIIKCIFYKNVNSIHYYFGFVSTVGCVLQSVPNHISKYRVHLFSLGTSLDFYCAKGTIFYPEKCACDWPQDRSSKFLSKHNTTVFSSILSCTHSFVNSFISYNRCQYFFKQSSVVK